MSGSTNGTEDGDGVFSMDSTDSPLVDEGNSGGSTGGAPILKKGPWTPAEDAILVDYVKKHGEGNWNAVQRQSGLFRCGKSCRLRWANHLRPNLKKGAFTPEEEHMIIELHSKFGNKWARMASHLSGRTDNEIKNYWNTRIKRRQRAGLPIYPANVQQQAAVQESDNNNNNNMMSCTEIQRSTMLNHDGFDISNLISDGLKANHAIFPLIPDIPAADILTKSFSAPSYFGFTSPPFPSQKDMYSQRGATSSSSSLSMVEQARLVEKRCALSSPYSSSSSNQSFFPFVGPGGRCSLPNCTLSSSPLLHNYPASATAGGGSIKSELPSFQYQPFDDYGGCTSSPCLPRFPVGVDPPFFQSQPPPPPPPPQQQSGAVESSVASCSNSGLLDALLLESYNMSSAANLSSEQSTSAPLPFSQRSASSAPDMLSRKSLPDTTPALPSADWNVSSDNEREEYWDMFSSMDESVASIFYDSDPNISIEGLLDEQPPHAITNQPPYTFFSGCNRKREEVQQHERDSGRVDDEDGGGREQNVTTNEVLSCFLGNKFEGSGNNNKVLGESYQGVSELGSSFLWNNMPPIFQLSGHHHHRRLHL